jgi:hypothetical protein
VDAMQRPSKNQIFVRGELRESVCDFGERRFILCKPGMNEPAKFRWYTSPPALFITFIAFSIHSVQYHRGTYP